jgi:hypothetical protein
VVAKAVETRTGSGFGRRLRYRAVEEKKNNRPHATKPNRQIVEEYPDGITRSGFKVQMQLEERFFYSAFGAPAVQKNCRPDRPSSWFLQNYWKQPINDTQSKFCITRKQKR